MSATSRTRRRVFSLMALVALAVPLGCGGGDGEGDGAEPTATGAPTSATTAPPATSAPEVSTVQVFFVDQDAFNVGRPPYATPVEREVASGADPARVALDALFEGPTEEERAAGLVLVTSEATGIGDLRIDDGTAHVHLEGGCSSGGSTLTVAEEIVPTMLQFAEVEAVKIYDPDGNTESPDEPGDSIPECLEP